MEIATAQVELRRSYFNGGVGAVISGVVWLAAAITFYTSTVSSAFSVLFFGGMFIFPLTATAIRLFTHRKPTSKENPGPQIVIETLFPMMAGLFAAWLFLQTKPEWTFPMAAIAVGAHYFGFRTAYGEPLYWVLGGLMCGVGFFSILATGLAGATVPFLIAAIEVVFGVILTLRSN